MAKNENGKSSVIHGPVLQIMNYSEWNTTRFFFKHWGVLFQFCWNVDLLKKKLKGRGVHLLWIYWTNGFERGDQKPTLFSCIALPNHFPNLLFPIPEITCRVISLNYGPSLKRKTGLIQDKYKNSKLLPIKIFPLQQLMSDASWEDCSGGRGHGWFVLFPVTPFFTC